MLKLLALLATTAFAGFAGASEPMSSEHKTEMKAADHKDMKAADHKDMKAADHKDMKAADHKDMKGGEHHHHHHHKHHGHKHHHHHDAKKPMMDGSTVTPTHEKPTTDKNYDPKNLGDSTVAPTGAWGSQHKGNENVKPTSYNTTTSNKSWGEDWWSREHRDQGKGGIASATPGSPDGEMSR